jgi:hypothetical protein
VTFGFGMYQCGWLFTFQVSTFSMVIISNETTLTPKILSDQFWVGGYFGQPLTYPDFTIFSSDFLCISLKS